MAYDVRPALLKGLVVLLKPSRQETAKMQAKLLEGEIPKCYHWEQDVFPDHLTISGAI